MSNNEQYFDRHNNPTPPKDPLDQALELQARSYRTEVLKSTWRGRSRGFWAGTAMGMVMGGSIGAFAALATAALPAISIGAAVSLVPIAAAAFAVTGMVLGASVCTSVGASASAVAGGLKEQDRRMLEDMLEEGKHISKSFKPDIDDPHPKTGFFQQFTQGSNKLFKWKVAAFGLAAGAMAGGVLIAAAAAGMSLPVVGAMSSMVGATLFGSGALGAAELAVVGQAISTMAITGTALFGAVFGFDMPTIATNTMNLMGKLLSGEAFESKEEARTRAINPDITKKLSEARQQPAKPAPAENTGVTAEEAKTLDQRLLATKHPSMFQQKEEQRKALSVSPGQGASI